MKSINWFKKKNLLRKSKGIEKLADSYLKKARKNLITMELLDKSRDYKKELGIPKSYDPSEWIVISGYYAMYLSALSVLAKIGYKSSNHTATLKALQNFLVKKEMLEKQCLKVLEEVKIKKDRIQSLDRAKDRREIAQYSVTKETTRNIADKTKTDAHDFVDRMERLLDSLE